MTLTLSGAEESTQDINKKLDTLRQALEQQLKQQRESHELFERKIREQQQQIEGLQQQLRLSTNAPTSTTSNEPPSTTAGATTRWQPSQPIRVGGYQNYLNLSLDGLFAAGSSTADDIEVLQPGAHDPNQRGFTVQNVEATLEGRVDPYFRAQGNIIFQIDAAGESALELEEAYMESLSLPWNLQVKGGQFFTEFGRHNPTHPHSWSFVDQPLVNARFLGPDGLRNPGARISWLAPTPFYSELFFAVQNSQGETAHSFRSDHEEESYLGRAASETRVRAVNDLLFTPRYAASFELSDSQTILAGVSAAFGPNASGPNSDTQIYGVDFFYKWKPVSHHGGFPFVTWQTELLARKFGAAASLSADLDEDGLADFVPGETLYDYGIYSQVAFGFRKGWVAALRGDYVTSDRADYERLFGRDPDRATRWRLSPNLTWYLTEFSKIRLQYNHDHRTGRGVDHSVWLQFEFLLGSHAAHKF